MCARSARLCGADRCPAPDSVNEAPHPVSQSWMQSKVTAWARRARRIDAKWQFLHAVNGADLCRNTRVPTRQEKPEI